MKFQPILLLVSAFMATFAQGQDLFFSAKPLVTPMLQSMVIYADGYSKDACKGEEVADYVREVVDAEAPALNIQTSSMLTARDSADIEVRRLRVARDTMTCEQCDAYNDRQWCIWLGYCKWRLLWSFTATQDYSAIQSNVCDEVLKDLKENIVKRIPSDKTECIAAIESAQCKAVVVPP
jgi:hypothetical protein